LGHIALSLDETRIGLAIGLTLIALGAGGIKPCVSAHVGDQFGEKNQHLLTRVFGWFYFSINLGAAVSSLLTPVLLEEYGSKVAFGVPAILMFLATLVFWMGRTKFVHIPPGGLGFLRDAFSREGLLVLGRLTLVFAFLVPFWALYDQTGSSWVLQAEHMSRKVAIPGLPTWELLPAQIQAVNPFLILLFIPLFSYVVYPWMARWFEPTPLRRMAIGFVLTAIAFAISAWIESRISLGERPHILWQVLAYIVLTAAEVLVWITGLEFSYTQAPPRMKSLVMSLGLLSVAAGNGLTAAINAAIAWTQPAAGSSTGWLSGASYYWLFTFMMLASSLVFLIVMRFYRGQTYLQDSKQWPHGTN
jgi:POT family proton-dependent oligopeptide transporter